jgi:hypothetical protein
MSGKSRDEGIRCRGGKDYGVIASCYDWDACLVTLEAGNRLSPTSMSASIKLIEDQLAAGLRAAGKLREKYGR